MPINNNHTSKADEAYQKYILQYVSRTFALTIPQLPETLRQVIGNAYLLCRLIDIIEDDNALDKEQTRRLAELFVQVVAGEFSARDFSEALYPRLSHHTTEQEHDLVKHTDVIIRITHSFNDRQRAALERCIRIMAEGMANYQDSETLDGLENLAAMNDYCYYVAGVVGEMLTELFCDYSAEIDINKTALMKLAVSFGQGLQMTNILKDIWEDRARGACWLPRDIFRLAGFDLRALSENHKNEHFRRGLTQLVAIAKNHLHNALSYVLLMPPQEKGIRKFCLWALGMAVLSLDKLNSHQDFNNGSEVKITRGAVRITTMVTSALVSNDWALRKLFDYSSKNLPHTDPGGKLGQQALGTANT